MPQRKIIQALAYLADRYIASKGAYQYMALSDADLKMFSESDIEALDKVYEAYGSMDGKELSDLSHKFQRDMTYVNCNSDKAVPLYPIAFKAATEG